MLGAIWGSSFILMKIGTRAFNTWEVSALRMFFAGALAIPFFYKIVKQYPKSTLGWMWISAMLGSAIPSLFYAYSAKRMDSNLNGVINSLTPLFTLVVGVIWLKYKVNRLTLLGVFIGFMGIVLLFTQKGTTLHQAQYAIFPLIATAMYGVNMNIVKVKLGHLPSFDILRGVFGMLGLMYLPIIIALGVFNGLEWNNIPLDFWMPQANNSTQKMSSLLAMLILGMVGSLFASFIFYHLLKKTNALFASTNTYLIPLMSIFWGFMDGEAIGAMHFVSLGIVLVGVYIVSLRR